MPRASATGYTITNQMVCSFFFVGERNLKQKRKKGGAGSIGFVPSLDFLTPHQKENKRETLPPQKMDEEHEAYAQMDSVCTCASIVERSVAHPSTRFDLCGAPFWPLVLHSLYGRGWKKQNPIPKSGLKKKKVNKNPPQSKPNLTLQCVWSCRFFWPRLIALAGVVYFLVS